MKMLISLVLVKWIIVVVVVVVIIIIIIIIISYYNLTITVILEDLRSIYEGYFPSNSSHKAVRLPGIIN
jgi:hypothetical protein